MNHKASLPSWGLLPKHSWKEQILEYKIEESTPCYSDFSALRYMLEFERKSGKSLKETITPFLGDKIKFWKELPENIRLLQCGYINKRPNFGKVHDPNAYNLDCYINHAGLFGTINGLSECLLDFEKKFQFIEKVQNRIKSESEFRFVLGFDRAQNENSLAGKGFSEGTFGHLGFTGTSFWIDPVKRKGILILTNNVKHFWYRKKSLNELRRSLGEYTWSLK